MKTSRRNLLKAMLGYAALPSTGIALTNLSKPIGADLDHPTYKDFDWLGASVSRVFRFEQRGANIELVSAVVCAKMYKLPFYTRGQPDLTLESFQKGGCTIYTNGRLLNEARCSGFTHIYKFTSYRPYGKDSIGYAILGAIRPDWKTKNGKLNRIQLIY